VRGSSPESRLPLVSLGGHGSSTPFFRACGLGGAQKGSGFFACSTPRRRRTGWVEKDTNGLALPRDQPAYADPSQPTMRARPTPRTLPGAPSAAVAEPVKGCYSVLSGVLSHGYRRRCGGPAEIGSVDPHAMHDHGKPACESDFRCLHATPFRDPHGPRPQRRPAAVMQQDVGRLGKGRCAPSRHHSG
jgi:hypothetical protein